MPRPQRKPAPAQKTKSVLSTDKLLVFVEELKRQWMATIDAMIDPLMIVKPDYTITKANKAMAELAAHPVKELIGKKCHQVFANSKTPCKNCRMLESAKKGETKSYNLAGIRGDKYFEVASQPIFAPDGSMDGVVQVYRDRTEARRLQEQLQQNEKLASIGLLAGGFAHEINNPLGGILIFSQMLLREIPKNSPHYQDVQEIEAATQRCKGIVESLLEFSRQRPAQPAAIETVDVIDAAKTALRFSKVGIKDKAIDIVENFKAAKTLVQGDRNKLIQVFLNLIQNAVQAMPDGGTLTLASSLSAFNGKPAVQIDVIDTGVGIPAAHLKKIFDPFFTTKDPGEGTGLGLAICYGIIHELGGALTVESKVNVRTKFHVRLPIAHENQVPAAS